MSISGCLAGTPQTGLESWQHWLWTDTNKVISQMLYVSKLNSSCVLPYQHSLFHPSHILQTAKLQSLDVQAVYDCKSDNSSSLERSLCLPSGVPLNNYLQSECYPGYKILQEVTCWRLPGHWRCREAIQKVHRPARGL